MAFTLLVCSGLSLFLIPAIIIRPFAYQSPGALTLAMATRQHAPLWTLVAALAAAMMAIVLWRRISSWKKPLVALALGLACAAAVMARVDYFEWMFHPVPAAGFEAADRATLDPSQMVMAVRLGADARAYPIRAMAYHHVVNDIVGGIPIAVTY